MRSFVETCFEDPGSELEPHTPADLDPTPPLLSRIRDPELRDWAMRLVSLWSTLSRRVRKEVAQDRQRYSLLPRRLPIVVPGGRFREVYYWWISSPNL